MIVEKYFKNDFLVTLGESKELNKKPHPDMCNKVLSILNSKCENTLYVGDSEVDILTATNANLKCISCTWGFRTHDELINAGADIIIDEPIELLKYLN